MSAALALMLAAAVFVPIPGPGGRGVGYVDGGSSLAATAYVEVSGKGEDRVVSAQMRKVPFRDVVRLLARGWSGQVTLSDSVPNPKIDLDLTNARVESALRAAVQRASREHPGLTFGRNNEPFFIYIPAEAGKPPPPGAPTGRLEPEAPRHITRELQAEPLHRAIERVFEGTGAEFLINTDVPDAPVTASIQDTARGSAAPDSEGGSARTSGAVGWQSVPLLD